MRRKLRVAAVLVGDIQRMPDMRVKYGAFFEALSRRVEVVDIVDASLHGVSRYWNALLTYRPSLVTWKERFFKNSRAFIARSHHVGIELEKMKGKVDVILQVGALLNPLLDGPKPPLLIYTDNTTDISMHHLEADRVGLSPRELTRWMTLEKQLYHQAEHICVRSEIVRSSLINDYGLDEPAISVVGAGINFVPLPEIKEKSSLPPPTVLFIGQEFYRKGGDLLLRAFAQARLHVPEARLLIITRDAVPQGYALENVQIKPPSWQREVIAGYYREADIFVLPSRLETWGDVLLEAMGFGLPCIGVHGQAMEDIIQDGVTGLLVDQSQTNDLAGALIQMLTKPAMRLRMGRAARELVESRFTWDHVAERFEPILRRIVRNR